MGNTSLTGLLCGFIRVFENNLVDYYLGSSCPSLSRTCGTWCGRQAESSRLGSGLLAELGGGGVCVSLSELLQVSKPQFVHADSDAHLEVPDAR